MKLKIICAALAVALAGPAAAAIDLDFTSSGIGTGSLSGTVSGISYSISGSNTLTNATHKNNVGCTGAGWDFACDGPDSNNKYDVGFGVQGGGNSNEVDGINNQGINQNEYVEVKFTSGPVFLNGFAGMLTYSDSASDGTEVVLLEYYLGGALQGTLQADPLNDDNDPSNTGDNKFDVVGLAFLDGLSLKVDKVRFKAGGTSPFDDGNANITAAGLKISAIPLPAGALLMLTALGGAAAYRRKQRKAA